MVAKKKNRKMPGLHRTFSVTSPDVDDERFQRKFSAVNSGQAGQSAGRNLLPLPRLGITSPWFNAGKKKTYEMILDRN